MHEQPANRRSTPSRAEEPVANRSVAPSADSLLALMQRRRSVRTGFLENVPVSDTQVETILEAARWAPSAGNSQPWEFIVVRDRATRQRIADLFKKQLQEKLEIERAIRGSGAIGGSVAFRRAPVLILVLGDPRTVACYPLRTREEKADSHFYSSLSCAVLQMVLMAECLGLASQYISDVSSPYLSLMLKHLLGIPAELKVYHLIPIGYVSRRPRSRGRRPLESLVHLESYDRGKFRSPEDIEQFVREESVQAEDYEWAGSERVKPPAVE